MKIKKRKKRPLFGAEKKKSLKWQKGVDRPCCKETRDGSGKGKKAETEKKRKFVEKREGTKRRG